MDNFLDIEERIHEFLQSLPCHSDLKDPPVKVEKPNIDYAVMLLDAYASSADSEVQAITQYIFHAQTIEDKIIKNALICISLVEMHHLDILSELITKLGGKPFFLNSSKNFWMTGNIAYVDKNIIYEKDNDDFMKDKKIIRMKLEKDIAGEINAINNYKILYQNINDQYIRKIILKIISDEEVHKKIFEELIGMINKK